MYETLCDSNKKAKGKLSRVNELALYCKIQSGAVESECFGERR